MRSSLLLISCLFQLLLSSAAGAICGSRLLEDGTILSEAVVPKSQYEPFEDCTVFVGLVVIKATSITNLDFLAAVESFEDIKIIEIDALESIALPSLTTVKGKFEIDLNPYIENVNPKLATVDLSSLLECDTFIIGDKGDNFRQDSKLTTINLQSLEHTKIFELHVLPELASLDLTSLTTIEESFIMTACYKLPSIVLPSLTHAGEFDVTFEIHRDFFFEDRKPASPIETIEMASIEAPNLVHAGKMTIWGPSTPKYNCCGATPSEEINLDFKLATIDLSSLRSSDNVVLRYSHALTSLDLSSLQNVSDFMIIGDHDMLETISLPSLENSYQLIILRCQALTTINAPSLKTMPTKTGDLGKALSLQLLSLDSLQSVNFDSLQSIGGFLNLNGLHQARLTFPSLTSVGTLGMAFDGDVVNFSTDTLFSQPLTVEKDVSLFGWGGVFVPRTSPERDALFGTLSNDKKYGALQTLEVSNVVSIGGILKVDDFQDLESFSFPDLVSVGGDGSRPGASSNPYKYRTRFTNLPKLTVDSFCELRLVDFSAASEFFIAVDVFGTKAMEVTSNEDWLQLLGERCPSSSPSLSPSSSPTSPTESSTSGSANGAQYCGMTSVTAALVLLKLQMRE